MQGEDAFSSHWFPICVHDPRSQTHGEGRGAQAEGTRRGTLTVQVSLSVGCCWQGMNYSLIIKVKQVVLEAVEHQEPFLPQISILSPPTSLPSCSKAVRSPLTLYLARDTQVGSWTSDSLNLSLHNQVKSTMDHIP